MTKRDRSPDADVRSSLSSKDVRTIFVNQLTQIINEDDLYEYFSLIGTVERVTVPRDHRSGKTRGFAYIEFYQEEKAIIATLLDQIKPDFQKFPIHIKRQIDNKLDLNQQSSSPKSTFIPLSQVPNEKKLYIGSIDPTVRDETVKQLVISLVGELERFKINRDYAGNSRGFGFAVFESTELVKKAIVKLDGYVLCGRPLKANYVTDGNKQQNLQPTGSNSSGSSSSSSSSSSDKTDTMNMNTSIINSQVPYQTNQDVHMGSWSLEADSLTGAKLTADKRLSLMRKLGERAGVNVPPSNMPSIVPVDNANPGGHPTPLLGEISNAFIVSNMFDPAQETEKEWYLDVQEEVAEECNKFGEVELCRVDKLSPLGLVYLIFTKKVDAQKAATSLHGRYFGQRFVTVQYMDETSVREKCMNSS